MKAANFASLAMAKNLAQRVMDLQEELPQWCHLKGLKLSLIAAKPVPPELSKYCHIINESYRVFGPLKTTGTIGIHYCIRSQWYHLSVRFSGASCKLKKSLFLLHVSPVNWWILLFHVTSFMPHGLFLIFSFKPAASCVAISAISLKLFAVNVFCDG